jgi:hypothetical protein
MMELVSVKLISVTGNQEEFGDLVGTTGKLNLVHGREWYHPTGAESVVLTRKRVSWKDGVIKIWTKLGNVFTFRALGG